MLEVQQTEAYARWFRRLRDTRARAQINVRIRRLSLGNPGDARPVGEGVSELRIDYGPGYRVYFVRRGRSLIVLLAGGDKDSQDRDIRRALELANSLEEGTE
ncbi:MAG: type II toxin-antitoxin system RelE/ParE family toxin [bacterium]|nr:type II toxin-antitoxin system RelE/ParE family toxin [bacterium]